MGYNSQPPKQDYDTQSYGGNYQQNCKTYYETVQEDKCEKYNEKVCYTTQIENCKDVPDQSCTHAITSSQERQCFNVTELKCRLQEDVQYETVQAVFTVQKCHNVQERVCDTVYDAEDARKDDFQCITVKNPVCKVADQVIYDKTCRTTTKFTCDYDASGYGGGYGAGAGYGNDVKDYCKRSYATQCYDTPRTVSNEVCFSQDQRVCEKLVNTVGSPKEKQVCHDEEKKVCELEQRSQPKQIKKYIYTVNCNSVPRQVCANSETKRIVPNCVAIFRKNCVYTPSEPKCEEIPKEYCYKVPKKVAKQKCYGPGYNSDDGMIEG